MGLRSFGACGCWGGDPGPALRSDPGEYRASNSVFCKVTLSGTGELNGTIGRPRNLRPVSVHKEMAIGEITVIGHTFSGGVFSRELKW